MNSSATPHPSKDGSRRWIKSRKILLFVLVVTSLLALGWQWENWRSARELKLTHHRLVELLGTDDPLHLAGPKVSDAQNYFSNSIFEEWKKVGKPGSVAVSYHPPENALLPKEFTVPELIAGKDGGADVLDFAHWVQKRAQEGRAAPAGETPEAALARELGDGNGLLPRLADGVDRPSATIKPSRREALEASGGNPWNVVYPDFRGLYDLQQQLSLHLRSAACVGQRAKTFDTTRIMLRFSEGTLGHGIMGAVSAVGLRNIAFSAIHEAMGHDVWTEQSLRQLQFHLAKFNDLEDVKQAYAAETLSMFQIGSYLRAHRQDLPSLLSASGAASTSLFNGLMENIYKLLMMKGPAGWHDANIAYYTECMMDEIKTANQSAWLKGTGRAEAPNKTFISGLARLNPRRIFAMAAIPHANELSAIAANTLFQRRCLIIACTLESYRLKHGGYPPTLDVVQEELRTFDLADPAQAAKPISYRQEGSGYLLWSPGRNGLDNGVVTDQDWLWKVDHVSSRL